VNAYYGNPPPLLPPGKAQSRRVARRRDLWRPSCGSAGITGSRQADVRMDPARHWRCRASAVRSAGGCTGCVRPPQHQCRPWEE